MVVEQGRQQVMRGSNGMKIAREMQVYILHWYHLGIATARCTAFHAETGAEAWLTQANNHVFADTF